MLKTRETKSALHVQIRPSLGAGVASQGRGSELTSRLQSRAKGYRLVRCGTAVAAAQLSRKGEGEAGWISPSPLAYRTGEEMALVKGAKRGA